MWDEVTYSVPNFNGCPLDVWEWISNFIPYFVAHEITYPWLKLKLIHVRRNGSWSSMSSTHPALGQSYGRSDKCMRWLIENGEHNRNKTKQKYNAYEINATSMHSAATVKHKGLFRLHFVQLSQLISTWISIVACKFCFNWKFKLFGFFMRQISSESQI